MATSTISLCLCTLTLALYISTSWAFPTRLYSEYDDTIDTDDIISNTEYQILSDIEDDLQSIKAKLLEIEELKALHKPEVPLANSDRFAMEVMNRRQEPEDYYSTRDRRTSWDTMPEGDTDEYITSPKEQLLDLIKLYNYLQSQRDSDAPSYRANKRQPPTGFHAVRGKRPSVPNFPSIKRPSSFDFPVSRRDPPVRGFSVMRGKK